MCCFDKYGDKNKDTIIYGNHTINLTYYHDTLYGFGILNHCLFKPISKNKFQGLNCKYFLIYKPFGDLLIRFSTILEMNNNFLIEIEKKKILFEIATKHNSISNLEFEQLINKANEFIIERKKLLHTSMMKNEELTREIKKKMLLLK